MARSPIMIGACTLAALGCALAGCFTPVTPPLTNGTTLTLVSGSWSGSTLPIVIAAVHSGASLAPSNLTYLVLDLNGSVYLNGPAGTGPPMNGARVSVAFGDTTLVGKLSAGDGILLTLNATAPDSYGNLTLDVLADGAAAAHLVLPAAPSPASQPHLELSAGSWSNGNLTVDITAVTNASGLAPSGLLFVVLGSTGTAYYSAGSGHPASGNGVTVNVVYQDTLDAGHVSVGDSIRVSISPANSSALGGGFLSVASFSQEIGRTSLG